MSKDAIISRTRAESVWDSGALVLRTIALPFRCVALVLITIGIIRITGMFTEEPSPKAWLFYTVLSNALCLVWVLLLVLSTIRDIAAFGTRGHSTPSARWSAAIMMAITVTMLVYIFVLVPSEFVQAGDYEAFSLTDNLIHVVTPLLLIVDWLLFVPKGQLRAADPIRWAFIPFGYLVLAFVYGALGGEFLEGSSYPYPFMNVVVYGNGGVALWIGGLSIGLMLIGYVYFTLDRLIAAISNRIGN
ncbi:Pr6Pr family membrane protein [Leucobacter denitrificans]|uniref:Pr6Pr family membrane protein n=1 Tax=Leucobacter denitrificans TaxID=683042 RepID=A0A7G9S635_9MICO|nr:Pr6Pr family membrane protein [Leucobacter denitrificans]QNN63310.1 Pr6Pr family membrane protein [Leucobacter denitrificans]